MVFMHKRQALVGMALLWISACSLAPPYVQPDLPVARQYGPSVRDDIREPSAASISWRDFIGDAQLREVIALALADNGDLRIATARLQETGALYRIQRSQLAPSVDAVATGNRGRTPADLSITGASVTSASYQAVLSVGWEIDFWGRLSSLQAAARETFLASAYAREAVATTLIAEVANTALRERELDERIAVALRTIDNRSESFRIVRRRFEIGAGSKLDVTQAETLLAQAQTELEALRQTRAENHDALTLLVGAPAGVAPQTTLLENTEIDTAIPAGLPSDLLQRRPDVVAAEHRLRAAHADIGAARAAFFPNISLTGAFGTASSQLDGLFKAGSMTWNFAPTISLPIFNQGRNRANLDVSEARRNLALAEYQQAVQRAFRDVADALAQRAGISAQIATTLRTLDALTERARLADLRYTNGRSAYLEVLEAQRDLFATQQALVQLRRAYLSSGISLYSALGGGFADDAPTPAPGRSIS